MMVSLLYFGPQWPGSTSLQRLTAFQSLEGVRAIGVDNGQIVGKSNNIWRRIRWKLRFPIDVNRENESLIAAILEHKPQIALIDNSKVIKRSTIEKARSLGVSSLVYYSPDDIVAPHNLSLPLKHSLSHWDVVCTTKTFNIPELKELGVERPVLVGKAFDPELHRPWLPEDVGAEFERFDAAFIGTYERERCASINALAESGVSVVVYGSDKGGWKRQLLHRSIELRQSVFDQDYVQSWHTGKVALCFLRKINRDLITQRTMEIAAIGRPMVAERTEEHDQHFLHGKEYLGFRDDSELVESVHFLLANDGSRRNLGSAGRLRCIKSNYSTHARAREMLNAFLC